MVHPFSIFFFKFVVPVACWLTDQIKCSIEAERQNCLLQRLSVLLVGVQFFWILYLLNQREFQKKVISLVNSFSDTKKGETNRPPNQSMQRMFGRSVGPTKHDHQFVRLHWSRGGFNTRTPPSSLSPTPQVKRKIVFAGASIRGVFLFLKEQISKCPWPTTSIHIDAHQIFYKHLIDQCFCFEIVWKFFLSNSGVSTFEYIIQLPFVFTTSKCVSVCLGIFSCVVVQH